MADTWGWFLSPRIVGHRGGKPGMNCAISFQTCAHFVPLQVGATYAVIHTNNSILSGTKRPVMAWRGMYEFCLVYWRTDLLINSTDFLADHCEIILGPVFVFPSPAPCAAQVTGTKNPSRQMVRATMFLQKQSSFQYWGHRLNGTWFLGAKDP